MKKLFYYIPAILYLGFILWAAGLFGFRSLELSAAIFALLFLITGFLLSKNMLLGGIIGIAHSIFLIYAGNISKTGLETPIGIFLLLFYLLCSYLVWKEKQ